MGATRPRRCQQPRLAAGIERRGRYPRLRALRAAIERRAAGATKGRDWITGDLRSHDHRQGRHRTGFERQVGRGKVSPWPQRDFGPDATRLPAQGHRVAGKTKDLRVQFAFQSRGPTFRYSSGHIDWIAPGRNGSRPAYVGNFCTGSVGDFNVARRGGQPGNARAITRHLSATEPNFGGAIRRDFTGGHGLWRERGRTGTREPKNYAG